MITINYQLDPKDPAEEIVITLDASPMLATGETLTSITSLTVITTTGTDATPALTLTGQIINSIPLTMLNGRTVAIGSAVQAVANAGNFGSTYWIRAVCPTSNPNKILTLRASLPMYSM